MGQVHGGQFLICSGSKKPGEAEPHEETWNETWNETTLSAIHPTGHSQQETPPGVREGQGMGREATAARMPVAIISVCACPAGQNTGGR